MASLEARKQSALLNKQEEELSQMVQVQATLSRLTARTHAHSGRDREWVALDTGVRFPS